MGKWLDMYFYKDSDGKFWVCRLNGSAYVDVLPHCFKTKAEAQRYIKDCGFKPREEKL